MITYKDLKIAINNQLKSNFKIPINSKDISEGFKRPSFFVEFDNISRSANIDHYEKSLTARIYFFPTSKDENSIEILEMQDELEMVFDYKLPVLDRQLNIMETNTIVSDGVLQFEFDLSFSDSKNNEEELPFVTELNFKSEGEI